jgi:hypothetical protein
MKGCPTYCNPAVAHADNLTSAFPSQHMEQTNHVHLSRHVDNEKNTEKRKREDSSEVDSQKTPPIAVVGVRRKKKKNSRPVSVCMYKWLHRYFHQGGLLLARFHRCLAPKEVLETPKFAKQR